MQASNQLLMRDNRHVEYGTQSKMYVIVFPVRNFKGTNTNRSAAKNTQRLFSLPDSDPDVFN